MKNNLARKAALFSLLAAPLAIVSCGGGGNPPLCPTEVSDPAACVFNPPVTINPGGTAGGVLFTTAPQQVTLDAGSDATYRVSGGTGGYVATSGNANVVRAVANASSVTLTAVSPGTSQIAIVDSTGGRITVSVTVLAQGAGGSPLFLTPGELTIGNCTSRVPFIFQGGVPPYTVFTSDNFNVPVTAALQLADGRSYFFADIKYALSPGTIVLGSVEASLTVLDSQSRSSVSTITTPLELFQPCPSNPLLKVFPESANFRTSEVLAFQVSGGPAVAASPTVTFADAGVATVVAVSPTTVTVRAVATARASTLMTLATADGQRATVVINVLPQ
ncbi:MAG: hypothetical protein Q8R63_02695 [Ramlibacter sp.]|nr:hypothetical protein [Ramlibacter sp.]